MKQKVIVTRAIDIGGDESIVIVLTREELVAISKRAAEMRKAISAVEYPRWTVECYDRFDLQTRSYVELEDEEELEYPDRVGLWEVDDADYDVNGYFSWTIIRVSNSPNATWVEVELSDDYTRYDGAIYPDSWIEVLDAYVGGERDG